MKFIIFHWFLKPLIKQNYALRKQYALTGKPPVHLDEWYWADARAVQWGYFVEFPGK